MDLVDPVGHGHQEQTELSPDLSQYAEAAMLERHPSRATVLRHEVALANPRHVVESRLHAALPHRPQSPSLLGVEASRTARSSVLPNDDTRVPTLLDLGHRLFQPKQHW